MSSDKSGMIMVGDSQQLAQTPPNMVKIILRAIGSAPSLTQQKFKLNANKTILDVEMYLHKKLEAGANKVENLFLYISNSGFSPTHDQIVGDLYRDFGTGPELILTYGIQETWG
jgi:hypothetical protein